MTSGQSLFSYAPPYDHEGIRLFLGRISKRIMVRSVALQKALSPKAAEVIIFKPSCIVHRDNGQIKIDQMAVVLGRALCGAYPVRIMAG